MLLNKTWDLMRFTHSQIQSGCSGTFYCKLFRDDNVPVISGDPQTDRRYLDAYRQQAELVAVGVGSFFEVIPPELDAPSKLVTSGLQVLRTHAFGLANLMDDLAEHQGLVLTPAQHRTGLEASMRAVMPYYLPTGLVTMVINGRLTDPKTHELKPETFVSNGNPDKFTIFPDPAIIQEMPMCCYQ